MGGGGANGGVGVGRTGVGVAVGGALVGVGEAVGGRDVGVAVAVGGALVGVEVAVAAGEGVAVGVLVGVSDGAGGEDAACACAVRDVAVVPGDAAPKNDDATDACCGAPSAESRPPQESSRSARSGTENQATRCVAISREVWQLCCVAM